MFSYFFIFFHSLWIPGPESNFIENMRYFRGFVELQDIVDKAIIQLSAENMPSGTTTEEEDWAVYTQQTPYPCYTADSWVINIFFSFGTYFLDKFSRGI